MDDGHPTLLLSDRGNGCVFTLLGALSMVAVACHVVAWEVLSYDTCFVS